MEIIPGIVRDEDLRDGIRVTIIATGFDEKKDTETMAAVIDLKSFVTPNFNTAKASSSAPAMEDSEGEMTLKLSDGQYEIPAYLRRRLASKPFQN